MAILTPSTNASASNTWLTSKHYFNKFTTGTAMSLVHNDVIDVLINNAIEKPAANVNATAGETGIIVVDNNGATTWAVAGRDFMSPNSNATLGTNQTISLGDAGYIDGSGNGEFINLTATTISTGTLHATTSVNSPWVNTSKVDTKIINGKDGNNGNLAINTVADSSGTWLGTVTINGALTVSNTITAPLINAPTITTTGITANTITASTVTAPAGNFTNLTINGRALSGAAVALIYFGTTAPGTEGVADLGYNLWVDTTANAQVLKYRINLSDTTSSAWTPLGAVFK